MSKMHCVNESGSIYFLLKALSDKLRPINAIKPKVIQSKARSSNPLKVIEEEKEIIDEEPIDWALVLFYKSEKGVGNKDEDNDQLPYIYEKEVSEFVTFVGNK